MKRHLVLFASLLVGALVVGCSHSSADRVPAVPESESTPSAAAEPSAAGSSERAFTVTGVSIDPKLMSGCGITDVLTFFELDSTVVDPPKDTVLFKLSECLSTGPLAGKKIRLVGHTDPRGSDRYNDELGKSRAQAVREYFVFHGIKHEAIEMLSMGEAGADEKSPAEWPFDRRVDVHLVP